VVLTLSVIAAYVVLIASCWIALRRWYLNWGATDEEVAGLVIGDDKVVSPNYETTLAVTIDAASGDVWPWLVQMGYQRGGLYSYDWLDRLFGYLDRPSAEHVLPQFQTLRAGDAIPLGKGPAFPVVDVRPFSWLVLAGKTDDFQWSWQLEIRRLNAAQVRLISRNRARTPRTAASMLFMAVLEPAAFIMTRKMLLGIKRRAEALSAGSTPQARLAA
jgi:hypothetical protein